MQRLRPLARFSIALFAGALLSALTWTAAPAEKSGWGGPRPERNNDPDQPGYVPSKKEEELPAELHKQVVFFRTNEPAGTIVVNTSERFLYHVQGNNRAIRYGIGVGREGFQWSGLKRINRKAEWPDWTPPPEMIERQPYLPRFMAGGPGNPMGARALYIEGTVYRIHGTNQPWTIGSAVSSGCFRLTNPDVTDLYDRVPVGTRVVVLQARQL
jgi:lipoprotein-anchoring transpeptidase ErfK/SrfK